MSLMLTDLQKRMLDGELGEPVRQGMELTVQLAKFWDAPDLIPVRSVHMPGASVKTARRAGRKYIRWVADEGGRFVTTTTLNPGAADLTGFDIGITPETMAQQLEITDSYNRMGAIASNTCTPYLVGNVPRIGEDVCWGESSAIVYSNSVLGARTNREGGPSALATALTGFTAGYGMHLQENRIASIHAAVDYPLEDGFHFGCAGYYLAKNFPDALPVYTGFPERCPTFGLKAVAAAMATSGSVSMYHAVGHTPEAPTLKAATGGRKLETVKIGKKEIEETRIFLNRTNESAEVDCVFIGCPHLDYEEIVRLVKLLKGRKVKSDVRLWLFAANSIWNTCERSGLTKVLKDAGAVMVSDTCPNITIFSEVIASRNLRSVALDSAKLAHYLPSWGLNSHYGTTADCIEAAVTGKWRV
jgi:predicted aconitase